MRPLKRLVGRQRGGCRVYFHCYREAGSNTGWDTASRCVTMIPLAAQFIKKMKKGAESSDVHLVYPDVSAFHHCGMMALPQKKKEKKARTAEVQLLWESFDKTG